MKKAGMIAAILFAGVFSAASAGSVFAAERIEVEQQTYEEASEGTGSGGGTWKWDGADALALNGFISEDPILGYGGGLSVTLEGRTPPARSVRREILRSPVRAVWT